MSRARDIAEKIKTRNEDYEDENIVVKIHPYSKLVNDTTDWHALISLSDLGLVKFAEKMLESSKLTPMSALTEARRSDLGHFKFENFHAFVLSSSERALRQSDIWVADGIRGRVLVAKHRNRVQRVEIPLSSLGRALRRFSYVNTIDANKALDYLIIKWFKGIDELVSSLVPANRMKNFTPEVIQSWKQKLEERKAHVLLGRRLYLSAPGTCLISFFSEEPAAGIDLWGFLDVKKDDAKIHAMWLNSTFNILQLLYMGVACEGPWMKIHDYMMDRLMVPNPESLSKDEKKQILELFEKIKDRRFPSISEQFKTGFEARKKIDTLWLKILGYKGSYEEILNNLYSSILKELDIIGQLMGGAKPESE
jgi:hypothetical protein